MPYHRQHQATELAHAKIDPVIVPSGCTMDIQAPDMAWNEPFKTKVTE